MVLYYLLLGQAGLLFILIMSILIFGKHHGNIRRLIAGEESKIGARSSAQSAGGVLTHARAAPAPLPQAPSTLPSGSLPAG